MMKMRGPQTILIEGVLAAALVVGLWFGWQELRQIRQGITQSQQMVENMPQQQLAQDDLASELKKQDARLRQLEKLLPPREAVGDVVAAIEGLEKKHGVRIIVPDVKEEIRYGRDNKPIPQTGPYLDIRLVVQGYGDPERLLAFIYDVEHLPYLLKIPTWEVTTHFLVVPAALTVSAPIETPAAQRPAGLLEAGVILTITRETL